MSEIKLNCYFDGIATSLLAVEQALLVANKQQTAIQVKPLSHSLEYEAQSPDLQKLLTYQVSPNATQISILDVRWQNIYHVPENKNIIYLPTLNISGHHIKDIVNDISRFDDIWVGDTDIQDELAIEGLKYTKLVHPEIYFGHTIDLGFIDPNKPTYLCYIHKNGIDSWLCFLEAYLISQKFANINLVVVSDMWACGHDELYGIFIEQIKNVKSKYNITNSHKIHVLNQNFPAYVDYCIINTQGIIVPDGFVDGWNHYVAKVAALNKQVICSPNSSMTKYLHSYNIFTDFVYVDIHSNEKIRQEAISSYKFFIENLDIEQKCALLDYSNKFSDMV